MREMAEAESRLDNDAADDQALDDRGTSAEQGLEILRRLGDAGFDGDSEKLAVALGRPLAEIEAWMQGTEPPDDDILMKARGIAKERGIEIE